MHKSLCILRSWTSEYAKTTQTPQIHYHIFPLDSDLFAPIFRFSDIPIFACQINVCKILSFKTETTAKQLFFLIDFSVLGWWAHLFVIYLCVCFVIGLYEQIRAVKYTKCHLKLHETLCLLLPNVFDAIVRTWVCKLFKCSPNMIYCWFWGLGGKFFCFMTDYSFDEMSNIHRDWAFSEYI